MKKLRFPRYLVCRDQTKWIEFDPRTVSISELEFLFHEIPMTYRMTAYNSIHRLKIIHLSTISCESFWFRFRKCLCIIIDYNSPRKVYYNWHRPYAKDSCCRNIYCDNNSNLSDRPISTWI